MIGVGTDTMRVPSAAVIVSTVLVLVRLAPGHFQLCSVVDIGRRSAADAWQPPPSESERESDSARDREAHAR